MPTFPAGSTVFPERSVVQPAIPSGLEALFESPVLLLEGVWEHLAQYFTAENEWWDSDPTEIVTDFDPIARLERRVLRVISPPPARLRRIAFNVISDLRHVLDQATYAAVTGVLGSQPPQDIFFPFSTSPNDLTHKLKKIPEPLHGVFRALEPYRPAEGFPGGDGRLRLLGSLAGPSKHRVALKVGVNSTRIEGRNVSAPDGIMTPVNRRIGSGIILFAYPPGRPPSGQFDIHMHVALEGAREAGDADFSQVAVWWHEKVTKVMNALASETSRILSAKGA